MWVEGILLYVAFCRKSRLRGSLLLFRMTLKVLYSAHYHRQHYTLHALEQFGALYMRNHDDKYPSQPEFKPGYKPQSIRMSHRGRPNVGGIKQGIYTLWWNATDSNNPFILQINRNNVLDMRLQNNMSTF